MFTLLRKKSPLRGSIIKFWRSTLLFLIPLFIFDSLILSTYNAISSKLSISTMGFGVLIFLGFTVLIWKTSQLIQNSKPIGFQIGDALLVAILIKCLWYMNSSVLLTLLLFFPTITALISSFAPELLQGANMESFLLILSIIVGSSIYLLLKTLFWHEQAKAFENKTKSSKGGFHVDQDLSFECLDDFNNCTSLEKLKKFDKLGRFDHAQQISNVIVGINPIKSFAIGINGEGIRKNLLHPFNKENK